MGGNTSGDLFKDPKPQINIMDIFWVCWMDLATGRNGRAGPAPEHEAQKFVEAQSALHKKLHFWKARLGEKLPWQSDAEMYKAFTGKDFWNNKQD